jgi:hypothetical protein
MVDAYEYWLHASTGSVYAIRLKDSQLTGACGPLDLSTATARENPSALDFGIPSNL